MYNKVAICIPIGIHFEYKNIFKLYLLGIF